MDARKGHGYSARNSAGGSYVARWVRVPVTASPGRRLRVLIYARYSTDEQNPRSIADQVAYCKRFLEGLGLHDLEIERLSDEGISGERTSRPGIDQVRAGVLQHRWDFIVCEDASRLYRQETACGELIETAVDENIRVFCINDYVDTADEDWDDRLHEALRHHAKANKYTSKRIKRAHEALWEMGAAIGLLKPGYIREPSFPTTEREPERGPFFDKVDPRWAPIIHEAYERIAAKEPTWSVGKRLTTAGLPKVSNSTLKEWTDANVIELIRRPIFRGWDVFRDKVARKKYRTGRRQPEQNDPEQVLTRPMPHLRIVPDWLWYAANAAIDASCNHGSVSSGCTHPQRGIPRDSRGPLSNLFFCHCGARMEIIGPNGYRCTAASYKKGKCWIKATTRRKQVHKAIATAIRRELDLLKTSLDEFLEHLDQAFQDDRQRERDFERLTEKERELLTAIANLIDMAEKSKDAPASLLERISQRENELARVRAHLEQVTGEQKALALPSRKEMLTRIQELEERLDRMDREMRADLQMLIGELRSVPCQQFGGNKIVLRARFHLDLVGLLPARLALQLRSSDGSVPHSFEPIPICVELFDRSTGPKHWEQALALDAQGCGPKAIGQRLKITKRRAEIALQYGKELRQAGLADPFIELNEPPAAGSRWRTHPRFADSGASADEASPQE